MSVNFETDPVGGTTLIIPAIQSANYAAGLTGWIIDSDGDAQFNELSLGNADAGIQITSFGNLIMFNADGNQVLILDATKNQLVIYQDTGASQGPVIFSAAGQTFSDPFSNVIPAGVTIGYTGIVPATPPAGQMVLYLDGSGNLLAKTSAGNVRTIAAV